MSGGVSELFGEVVLWATGRGATSIKDLPGCWEGRLDVDDKRKFRVSVNGHPNEVSDSKGTPVPGFHALIKDETYLRIALCSPAGGMVLGGSPDFEGELIELFRSARGGVA